MASTRKPSLMDDVKDGPLVAYEYLEPRTSAWRWALGTLLPATSTNTTSDAGNNEESSMSRRTSTGAIPTGSGTSLFATDRVVRLQPWRTMSNLNTTGSAFDDGEAEAVLGATLSRTFTSSRTNAAANLPSADSGHANEDATSSQAGKEGQASSSHVNTSNHTKSDSRGGGGRELHGPTRSVDLDLLDVTVRRRQKQQDAKTELGKKLAREMEEKQETLEHRIEEVKRRMDTLREEQEEARRQRAKVEDDFAAARAELARARDQVEKIDQRNLKEIQTYRTPPKVVQYVMSAVFNVLGTSPNPSSVAPSLASAAPSETPVAATSTPSAASNSPASASLSVSGASTPRTPQSAMLQQPPIVPMMPWNDIVVGMRNASFLSSVLSFEPALSLRGDRRVKLYRRYIKKPKFTYEDAVNGSAAIGDLYNWVVRQLEATSAETQLTDFLQTRAAYEQEIAEKREQLVAAADELDAMEEELDDLEEQLAMAEVGEFPTGRPSGFVDLAATASTVEGLRSGTASPHPGAPLSSGGGGAGGGGGLLSPLEGGFASTGRGSLFSPLLPSSSADPASSLKAFLRGLRRPWVRPSSVKDTNTIAILASSILCELGPSPPCATALTLDEAQQRTLEAAIRQRHGAGGSVPMAHSRLQSLAALDASSTASRGLPAVWSTSGTGDNNLAHHGTDPDPQGKERQTEAGEKDTGAADVGEEDSSSSSSSHTREESLVRTLHEERHAQQAQQKELHNKLVALLAVLEATDKTRGGQDAAATTGTEGTEATDARVEPGHLAETLEERVRALLSALDQRTDEVAALQAQADALKAEAQAAHEAAELAQQSVLGSFSRRRESSTLRPPQEELTTTTHTHVFDGPDWAMVLEDSEPELRVALTNDISALCGVPTRAISDLTLALGSLHVSVAVEHSVALTSEDIQSALDVGAYPETDALYELRQNTRQAREEALREKEEAAARFAELEKELETAQREEQAVRKQLAKCEEQLAKREKDLTEAHRALTSRRPEDAQRLVSQTSSQIEALDELREQIAFHETVQQANELNRLLMAKEEQLIAADAMLREKESELELTKQQMERRYAAQLESQRAAHKVAMEELRQSLERAEAHQQEMREEVHQQQQQQPRDAVAEQAMQRRLEELEQALAESRRDAEALRQSAEEREALSAQYEKACAEAKAQAESLQTERQQQQEHLARLEKEKEVKMAEVEQRAAEAEEKARKLVEQAAEQSHKEAVAQVADMQNAQEAQTQRLREMEMELNTYKDTHETCVTSHTHTFEGDEWGMVLEDSPDPLRRALTNDIAANCGVPSKAVQQLHLKLGSLVATFDVEHLKRVSADEIDKALAEGDYPSVQDLYANRHARRAVLQHGESPEVTQAKLREAEAEAARHKAEASQQLAALQEEKQRLEQAKTAAEQIAQEAAAAQARQAAEMAALEDARKSLEAEKSAQAAQLKTMERALETQRKEAAQAIKARELEVANALRDETLAAEAASQAVAAQRASRLTADDTLVAALERDIKAKRFAVNYCTQEATQAEADRVEREKTVAARRTEADRIRHAMVELTAEAAARAIAKEERSSAEAPAQQKNTNGSDEDDDDEEDGEELDEALEERKQALVQDLATLLRESEADAKAAQDKANHVERKLKQLELNMKDTQKQVAQAEAERKALRAQQHQAKAGKHGDAAQDQAQDGQADESELSDNESDAGADDHPTDAAAATTTTTTPIVPRKLSHEAKAKEKQAKAAYKAACAANTSRLTQLREEAKGQKKAWKETSQQLKETRQATLTQANSLLQDIKNDFGLHPSEQQQETGGASGEDTAATRTRAVTMSDREVAIWRDMYTAAVESSKVESISMYACFGGILLGALLTLQYKRFAV